MHKNLYDSNKLVVIIYERQHEYQARFVGKCLSFSKDVCVPLPRYKHFHLFEHGGIPAMWNSWFLKDNQSSMIWLDWGWNEGLDFAQKQGYLNTYRTEEVDTFLESGKHGVMAVRVNKVNQSVLTEMCLIFPRAKIIALTKSRKLKSPFGFNVYYQQDPKQISPYDASWIHGMDMWISNRQMAMRQVSQALGIKMVQSECQAFFNKAGEHLPGYKTSGHWGRYHTLRFTLEPEATAMIKVITNDIIMDSKKIKQETDFYYEVIESKPTTTIQIEQFNLSHAERYNVVNIKNIEINDQDVNGKGTFYPRPDNMVIRQYLPDDLTPKPLWESIDFNGYWEIKTDGINIL